MKKTFFKLGFSIILFSLLVPAISQARTNVSDWYIKDFTATIEIQTNDTAIITEDIVADCGNSSKHGIFRTLPTQTKTPDGTIQTPIELISITNSKNQPYNYQTTKNNNTITWKIGDANKTVTGENKYQIKYSVKNIIREQESFDELYWNILGNFWDLEIDNFEAKIIFPSNINKGDINLEYYSGKLEEKKGFPIEMKWINSTTLLLKVNKTILKENGITLSANFPKGSITHIGAEELEKYTETNIFEKLSLSTFVFSLIILPIIILIILLTINKRKKKKNPFYKQSIVPHYEAPDNISPFLLGYMDKKQMITSKLISASIIKLATLNLITIEEKKKKVVFSSTSYLDFKKTNNQENYEKLSRIEKYIYNNFLFSSGDVVSSLSLSNNSASKLREIQTMAKEEMKNKNYIKDIPKKNKKILLLIIIMILLFSFSFPSFLIMLFFIKPLSKNLSEKGQEIMWKIEGFKMYMTTAETERHKFYEEENIFTKLLPYSIALGNVKEWTKKMQDIYSEEYIKNSFYWYSGITAINALNIDQTISKISSISTQINNTVGTSSGSSGGGFSGGGSGGGGGGGW